MSIDLSERCKEELLRLVRRHVADAEIRVFGSRVHGPAKPFADLDLVLMGEAEIAVERLAALALDLEESDLPMKVDVLDWSRLDASFRGVIAADSVPLA